MPYTPRFFLLAAPAAAANAAAWAGAALGAAHSDQAWDFWLVAAGADARGICREVLHVAHCPPWITAQQHPRRHQQGHQQRAHLPAGGAPGSSSGQPPRAGKRKRASGDSSSDESQGRACKAGKRVAGVRDAVRGRGHPAPAPAAAIAIAAVNGSCSADDGLVGSHPGAREQVVAADAAEGASPGADGAPAPERGPSIALPAALQWCHRRVVRLSLVLQLQARPSYLRPVPPGATAPLENVNKGPSAALVLSSQRIAARSRFSPKPCGTRVLMRGCRHWEHPSRGW